MAVKKHSYSVETPHGVFTRTTANNYTHVVYLVRFDGKPSREVSWCSRLDLAHKKQQELTRYWGDRGVVHIAEVK